MDICYVASDFTMLWIKVSRMGLLDVSAFDDDGLYYRNYSIDSKIKKRIVKICIMSTFVILLLISSPIFYLIVGFGYTPEHVVEKDGSKYVAYVNSFLRTYVYYYDYKNVVVVGNQKRIVEDYGKGGFDPLGDKYPHKIEHCTYYDEKGNVISNR